MTYNWDAFIDLVGNYLLYNVYLIDRLRGVVVRMSDYHPEAPGLFPGRMTRGKAFG